MPKKIVKKSSVQPKQALLFTLLCFVTALISTAGYYFYTNQQDNSPIFTSAEIVTAAPTYQLLTARMKDSSGSNYANWGYELGYYSFDKKESRFKLTKSSALSNMTPSCGNYSDGIFPNEIFVYCSVTGFDDYSIRVFDKKTNKTTVLKGDIHRLPQVAINKTGKVFVAYREDGYDSTGKSKYSDNFFVYQFDSTARTFKQTMNKQIERVGDDIYRVQPQTHSNVFGKKYVIQDTMSNVLNTEAKPGESDTIEISKIIPSEYQNDYGIFGIDHNDILYLLAGKGGTRTTLFQIDLNTQKMSAVKSLDILDENNPTCNYVGLMGWANEDRTKVYYVPSYCAAPVNKTRVVRTFDLKTQKTDIIWKAEYSKLNKTIAEYQFVGGVTLSPDEKFFTISYVFYQHDNAHRSVTEIVSIPTPLTKEYSSQRICEYPFTGAATRATQYYKYEFTTPCSPVAWIK